MLSKIEDNGYESIPIINFITSGRPNTDPAIPEAKIDRVIKEIEGYYREKIYKSPLYPHYENVAYQTYTSFFDNKPPDMEVDIWEIGRYCIDHLLIELQREMKFERMLAGFINDPKFHYMKDNPEILHYYRRYLAARIIANGRD